MMKINSKETFSFSKISKDTNRIHLNKKIAGNFFIKEPIVHGINLALIALSKFIKKKNSNILITNISLNFKNFLNINEKFSIKFYKNKIIVHNDFHNKLEIHLKYRKIKKLNQKKIQIKKKIFNLSFQKLENIRLIEQLIFSSYYVGSVYPGNGSLILNINIKHSKKYTDNSKPKILKKIKNISVINYQKDLHRTELIACKLVPFRKEKKKNTFSVKTVKKLKGKKILIFGSSSDLSNRVLNLKKNNIKIYRYSFRIDLQKPKIDSQEKKNLKKMILKIKPDYIFYFSSAKIYYDEKHNNKLFNLYKVIFVDYLKNMINLIIKNQISLKIFYPSTIFLNNKKKYIRYKSYLKTKEMAEKIINSIKNNDFITCVRLPKLKSRSNYNLLGFYEGENIKILDKYLEKFF